MIDTARFTHRGLVKMQAGGFIALFGLIYLIPQLAVAATTDEISVSWDKQIILAVIAVIGGVVTVFGQLVRFLRDTAHRRSRRATAPAPHTHPEIDVKLEALKQEVEELMDLQRSAETNQRHDRNSLWSAVTQIRSELGSLRTDVAAGQDNQARKMDEIKRLLTAENVTADQMRVRLNRRLDLIASALAIDAAKFHDDGEDPNKKAGGK